MKKTSLRCIKVVLALVLTLSTFALSYESATASFKTQIEQTSQPFDLADQDSSESESSENSQEDSAGFEALVTHNQFVSPSVSSQYYEKNHIELSQRPDELFRPPSAPAFS